MAYSLLHCFNSLEEYDQGYEFLTHLREKGIFPRRVHLGVTFNNAGWLVCAKAFSDSKFDNEATELLREAERIYASENNADVAFPLNTMTLLFVAKGDSKRAKEYAWRFRESVATGHLADPPDWRREVKRLWFQSLERRKPNVSDELKQVFKEDPALPN